MGYSQVQIYNIALNQLGVTANVQNINQIDPTVAILNNHFQIAKEKVLKDFDWNFATVHRNLTATGNSCANPKFSYEYDYPNDCISPREVLDISAEGNARTVKFAVGSNASGNDVIYTNVSPAKLRYTRRIDRNENLTPEFVMSLALYLAALTGEAITGIQSKANNCLQAYLLTVREAKVANANESTDKDEDDSTWLDSRF